jgi:hypothetical protein
VGIEPTTFGILAVARHIFRACPVWIYTQSNITSIIYDAVIELQPKFIFIKKIVRKCLVWEACCQVEKYFVKAWA